MLELVTTLFLMFLINIINSLMANLNLFFKIKVLFSETLEACMLSIVIKICIGDKKDGNN